MAGLQLAHAFCADGSFSSKSIAIIEPRKLNTNDKRWSYWEKGVGKWDNLVSSKWSSGRFVSRYGDIKLKMGGYIYKSVQSLDFYNHITEFFKAFPNVHFINGKVSEVNTEINAVYTASSSFQADYIFDSRPPSQFGKSIANGTSNLIHQHFKGWVIKTDEAIFNTHEFTMMDFTAKFIDTCSFMYILPYSTNEGLIEMTFFTPKIDFDGEYDQLLKKYISDTLKIDNFEVIEVEEGNIPMTDFPFQHYNNDHYLRIGTGGGWVKGSTGYSFKRCEKFVEKIIGNLKNGERLDKNLYKSRFLWYDKIFLRVLKNYNHLGEKVFYKLYSKNPHPLIFNFLDEETHPSEELKIMGSLFSWEFVKSIFKN